MAQFMRSASPVRWAVLFLACLSMLGSYYCYDNPTALQKQMTEAMGINNTQYNLFYSVYSFPNVALPFFGGLLVDKFGTNVTLFTFLCFIVLGQAIFAIGFSLNTYWIAVLGRVVFGFGGESLSVAQTTLLALWFAGKEMAFAMGINLSVARLGSVINDQTSPAVYKAYSEDETDKLRGVAYALWLGFFVCVMSLTATLILIAVEKYAMRRAAATESASDKADRETAEQEAADLKAATPKGSFCEELNNQLRFGEVKEFSKSFWLITGSCVVVYATVLPFNNIAGDLLQEKYDYSLSTADRLLAIPFAISAVCSPFLGGIVDRFGHRVRLLTGAAYSLTCAHLLIGLTNITPYVPLCIIGFSYSVYAAAIWPSVSFVVLEHQLGTAYGLITAVQNMGLASAPLLVGTIKDQTGHYKWVEVFFACVGACGVVLGTWLHRVDAKNGGILNKSHYNAEAGAGGGDKAYETLEEEDMDFPEPYNPSVKDV